MIQKSLFSYLNCMCLDSAFICFVVLRNFVEVVFLISFDIFNV